MKKLTRENTQSVTVGGDSTQFEENEDLNPPESLPQDIENSITPEFKDQVVSHVSDGQRAPADPSMSTMTLSGELVTLASATPMLDSSIVMRRVSANTNRLVELKVLEKEVVIAEAEADLRRRQLAARLVKEHMLEKADEIQVTSTISSSKTQKILVCCSLLLLAIAIGAIAIGGACAAGHCGNSGGNSSLNNSTSTIPRDSSSNVPQPKITSTSRPTSSPSPRPALEEARAETIQEATNQVTLSRQSLRYPLGTNATPEEVARAWLIDDDPARIGVATSLLWLAQRQPFALESLWFRSSIPFHSDSWLKDANECNWEGVSCDQYGKEVEVNLQTNTRGQLPSELGLLTKITTFDLGFVQLGGTIPESLGLLRKMTILDLGQYELTGKIPPLWGC